MIFEGIILYILVLPLITSNICIDLTKKKLKDPSVSMH